MVEQPPTGSKKERSPGYPAIGLEEAINKVRKLYQQERRNPAPIQTVLKHWGYAAKSGPGFRAIAALEKFGLITSEGSGDSRKIRLSEDAFNILVDERPDSPDRLRLIQKAALRPPIHNELWEQYRLDLPSDPTLRYELRMKGFTDSAAAEFAEEYRGTLAFAKLGQRDILSGREEDKSKRGEGPMAPPAPPPPNACTIQLPVAAGEWAVLQAAFPLTESKWKQLVAVLEAMKPALVIGNGGPDKPIDLNEPENLNE